MFKFTLTSIALLGLVSFASAQTNINRINGNGNTVINRSVGGSGSFNVNKINGNGNTVINRTQPSSSPTLVGGDPSTWSPTYRPVAPVVVYKQPVQYVEPQVEYYQEESAPVCETESIPAGYVPMPVYVTRPQMVVPQPVIQPIHHHTHVRPAPSPSPSVNLNFNLNQINGNGNRVVNNTTGGGSGASININRINGNGNTVVNRTRP
ncbi:MAG: hypothetical protein U0744_09475 [Gemmataceae bacterium]